MQTLRAASLLVFLSTVRPAQKLPFAWNGALRRFLLHLPLLAAFFLTQPATGQQTDTIRMGDRRLKTSRLRPGTRQYLVYFYSPTRPKMLGFWLWRRELQATRYQGQPVFHVRQHWYGSDTSSYREIASLVRAADFAPLYHTETMRGQRKAYNWSPTGVTGADSVAENQARAYELAFQHPVFNWNLDIETFELLPLAAGKRFAIPFYEAGSQPPKYVVYTVVGREVLTLPGAAPVACWKLFTEGKTPAGAPYSQTFWISQRGHEFLKEEDQMPNYYRYKVKTSTVPDAFSRRPASSQ